MGITAHRKTVVSSRQETREKILEAARTVFATSGYDAATIARIAEEAGVDPALVHRHYRTKEQLFVAAMRLPVNPAEIVEALLARGLDGIGEQIVGAFLTVWDTAGADPLVAVLGSAFGGEQSARMLREFMGDALFRRVMPLLDVDQPRLRVNLVASQVFGLAFIRYVLRLEPLASADVDTVVATVGPTLQRYLTGPLA